MSTETPDTSEAIKIALASAETASDAAALADKTSKKMSNKAEWVDKKLIPAGIGGLVAITICAGLSGLVYFRTLSDLRTARDTHVEALHLFTQNVNKLNEAVQITQDIMEAQNGERAELAKSIADMTARLTDLDATMTTTSEAMLAALGEGPESFVTKLSMSMDPKVDVIRDDILVGLSDLQVALSQKMTTVVKQMEETAKMASKPQQSAEMKKPMATPAGGTFTAQAPKPKPKPRTTARKSAPKPPKNPFSYP